MPCSFKNVTKNVTRNYIMINLPNGCSCSEMAVFPKNWKSGGIGLLKKEWYVQYYFRDPNFSDKYKYGKQVRLKGINAFKTLEERRSAVTNLIENELLQLKENGYNPILGKTKPPEPEQQFEISPDTIWLEALELARLRLKITEHTKTDIKNYIKSLATAAQKLRYEKLAISAITRKHIKMCLSHLQAERGWGGASYNRYRTYLIMCFKELLELEAVGADPVSSLAKQDETPEHPRQILTERERVLVDAHLKKNYYKFWRYLQISFDTGCRTSELFLVQGKNVDLPNQRFRMTILKGRKKRVVWRPISNEYLHLWEELLAEAQPEDYVFSRGLVPGPKNIRPDQITKRWYRLIKKSETLTVANGGVPITADFYSNKHLRLEQIAASADEIAKDIALQKAAEHAGHTTTAMVRKIYAVGERERELERGKKRVLKFAK